MGVTFSILTPSFNQGRFLARNLLSVQHQDLPARQVQHIVIDAGSTDETRTLLRASSDRLGYWVSEPDDGQAHALTKALAQAEGDYVGWLNADEYYEPNVLGAVRDAFAQNPDAVLVYGDVRRVDGEGRSIRVNRQWRFDFDICQVQTPIIINCGAFFRRDRLLECGGFDASWRYLMDWELYIRFMRGNQRWVKLRQVLGNFIMHPQSKTATSQAGFEREIARLQQREFPGWTQEAIEAHKHRQKQRMMTHMLLDGVLFEKAYFKLVRQRQYAHLFGDAGARLPVVSRVLDWMLPPTAPASTPGVSTTNTPASPARTAAPAPAN